MGDGRGAQPARRAAAPSACDNRASFVHPGELPECQRGKVSWQGVRVGWDSVCVCQGSEHEAGVVECVHCRVCVGSVLLSAAAGKKPPMPEHLPRGLWGRGDGAGGKCRRL